MQLPIGLLILFCVLPFITILAVLMVFMFINLHKKDKVKIDLGRQGNFILAILLTYFLFFGYISNIHPKTSNDLLNSPMGELDPERIVFIYQILFTPYSILSLVILILIVFLMAFREKFFEYGLRNSFWLSFFIIGMSFIWYWFVVESFDISIIGKFFITYEGYLTILILIGINMSTAILASLARQKYDKFKSY